MSRSLASSALRGGSDQGTAGELEAARLATHADQALANAVARNASEAGLQALAQIAAPRHRTAAAKVTEAAKSQPQLQLFGLAPISTTAAIRAQLPNGAAILIYAIGCERGYAALLSHAALQIERLALSRADIAAAVGRVRTSTEFLLTPRGAVTRAFAQGDAKLLYRILIAPFKPTFGTLNRLYISRTAPLNGLPFAALRDPVSHK